MPTFLLFSIVNPHAINSLHIINSLSAPPAYKKIISIALSCALLSTIEFTNCERAWAHHHPLYIISNKIN